MPLKLTPEQQADLSAHAGQAVPIQDDQGNIVCYLVDVSSFLHLQSLSQTQDEQSRQKLQSLIQEGMDSPDVPAAEAHQRIRQMAKEASEKYA